MLALNFPNRSVLKKEGPDIIILPTEVKIMKTSNFSVIPGTLQKLPLYMTMETNSSHLNFNRLNSG